MGEGLLFGGEALYPFNGDFWRGGWARSSKDWNVTESGRCGVREWLSRGVGIVKAIETRRSLKAVGA